ncbi:MAG TPA: tRNA lysidine(34) synthetase TilS [Balneolales bacterium]|nr:tRNA lysidine(34) synthetase TilS [Balneolales bacterium]
MLFSSVINILEDHQIDPHTDSLVIGVSGGIDSMVLLSVLKKMNFRLIVVHVNYHKRGTASDKDQELVMKTAKEFGYPCIVHAVYPDKVKGNFQKWARTERYKIFESVRNECNARAIAVAHHQDDQIETILQKIMRGAGIESWQGMPVLEGYILRPLLQVSRSEIQAYAKEHNIPYRNDASNFESNYARNFLRNEWIPYMDQLLPGWQKNIAGIPQKSVLFEESLDYIVQHLKTAHDRIGRKALLALSENLQKSVINHFIKKEFGLVKSVSASSLDNLQHLKQLQTGGYLELSKQLIIVRDRDSFVIRTIEEEAIHLEKLLKKEDVEGKSVLFNGYMFTYTNCIQRDYGKALYVNLSQNDWPVTIRKWRNGDRFQPLGMNGHKKISDLLTDKKIDASLKNEAMVIVSFEETICAVIFPQFKNSEIGSISENYKCVDSTKKALVIQK